MATVTKPIALDETLQATNTKLQTIGSNAAKDTTLQSTNTALGALTKDTTLQATNTKLQETNTTLGVLAKDATMQAFANALIEALSSVKSVNGKYGVVVLDSGDILISKTAANSKTVNQMLTEMETAISMTPLTFSTTLIEEGSEDYKMIITQGTPS